MPGIEIENITTSNAAASYTIPADVKAATFKNSSAAAVGTISLRTSAAGDSFTLSTVSTTGCQIRIEDENLGNSVIWHIASANNPVLQILMEKF